MHPFGVPGGKSAIARQILADIDAACVAKYSEPHRHHLGASVIGDECARKLWYGFRWIKTEKLTGQQLRLFNRGHKEEARIVEWLQWIGAEVIQFEGNGKQARIGGVGGHFGGSMDAKIRLPERYGLPDMLLCEFKTANDRSFSELSRKGVQLSKPQHFAQMSQYAAALGMSHALYICINKNDDNLHIEIVTIDPKLAEDNIRKAADIILAKQPPKKLSETPTFFKCKMCAFAGVCHGNEASDTNCRSCEHAYPVEGGEWACAKHQSVIPRDFLPKGCEMWRGITDIPL